MLDVCESQGPRACIVAGNGNPTLHNVPSCRAINGECTYTAEVNRQTK